MRNGREHSKLATQLLGAAGLVVVIGACAFLVAMYQKAFVDVAHVTITSDRAGLLLDPGTRVRLAGVPVGEVRRISLSPDESVAIDVAIDADEMGRIPANVRASIRSTTVFGAKFVDLSVPHGASSASRLAGGDTIRSDGVTVEANDVFAHALKVMTAVDPRDLNATLGETAAALRGRGPEIGRMISDWNTYFKALEPHLDELALVLKTAPSVVDTYAQAAPALISTADNLGSTSSTLVDNRAQLETLLHATVTSADSASSFLRALYAPLSAFNREWVPVTALLARYAPEYGCVISALRQNEENVRHVYGNQAAGEHYLYARTGFLPGQKKYDLAENRPKIMTGLGPRCYDSATAAHPTLPHVRFDDGTRDVYRDAQNGPTASDPLSLYGTAVSDWLGTSGLNALLQNLGGGQ